MLWVSNHYPDYDYALATFTAQRTKFSIKDLFS